MQAGDDKFLFNVFFLDETDIEFEIVHKGEKFSLWNTSRIQNTEFVG